MFGDGSAAPKLIEGLAPTSGAALDTPEVKLTCRVECQPLCDVEWLRDGVVVPAASSSSSPPRYVQTDAVAVEDARLNRHRTLTSTLSLRVRDAWPRRRLDPVRDVANYTCSVGANSVGGPVSSTTLFRVECKSRPLDPRPRPYPRQPPIPSVLAILRRMQAPPLYPLGSAHRPQPIPGVLGSLRRI